MSWDKNVKGRSFASSDYEATKLTMMYNDRQVLARASMLLRKPKWATVSNLKCGTES